MLLTKKNIAVLINYNLSLLPLLMLFIKNKNKAECIQLISLTRSFQKSVSLIGCFVSFIFSFLFFLACSGLCASECVCVCGSWFPCWRGFLVKDSSFSDNFQTRIICSLQTCSCTNDVCILFPTE